MRDVFLKIVSSEPFWTVLTGTVVYILSQLFVEFVIYPRRRYNEIRQKIIYNIKMYCCFYTNPYNPFNEEKNARPKEEYDYASKEIRKIGAELASYIGTIPKCRYRKKKKLENVRDCLIGLSNGFYNVSGDYNTSKENKKLDDEIRKKLNF